MLNKNHMINTFLIRDKLISEEEYKILFKDKDYWENNLNYKPFINTLHKIIELQKDEDTIYLNNICFPNHIEFKDLNISPSININFNDCSFYQKINFHGIHFTGKVDFSNTYFYKEVNFRKTKFDFETSFSKSKFLSIATFNSSSFQEKTHFKDCQFQEISFQDSIFKKDCYFGNSHFQNKVNFLDAKFQENSNFDKCIFDGTITSFTRCIFNTPNFTNSNFKGEVSFRGITCQSYSYFNNIIFSNKVEFNQSKFLNNVNFENTQFESAYFFNTKFNNIVSFKNAISNKIISFEAMSCGMLDMINSNFSIVNFLNIKGKDYFPLKKTHLKNKETARIIKSHLEKQHNLIESNKFFVFEQEKYYDELSWVNNFGNKFVVWLNKRISNHQTSWGKVLFAILAYICIILLGYSIYTDYSLSQHSIMDNINKGIELIDPLNIFKKDNTLYANHQALGLTIRIISLYLFWQFAVAFRQNTRRK